VSDLILRVDARQVPENFLRELKSAAQAHPGNDRLLVHLLTSRGNQTFTFHDPIDSFDPFWKTLAEYWDEL
jgi:hypothetical protein